MQKKSKVSSWPSWEEASEEPEKPNIAEEKLIEDKPRYKSAEKPAAGGVMVVYDAPTGGSPVIEINAPRSAAGHVNVQVSTESSILAKIGFVMSLIGGPAAIVGVCMYVLGLNIDGWYETINGVRSHVIWVYNTSILLAGIGTAVLLLGIVFSMYGRYIRGKATDF